MSYAYQFQAVVWADCPKKRTLVAATFYYTSLTCSSGYTQVLSSGFNHQPVRTAYTIPIQTIRASSNNRQAPRVQRSVVARRGLFGVAIRLDGHALTGVFSPSPRLSGWTGRPVSSFHIQQPITVCACCQPGSWSRPISRPPRRPRQRAVRPLSFPRSFGSVEGGDIGGDDQVVAERQVDQGRRGRDEEAVQAVQQAAVPRD